GRSSRSRCGLRAKDPRVIGNGPNPGMVSAGEQGEAMLDIEWSGAVAKNASIKFVVSASTSSSDGVFLSAQYAVNQNLAPVITVSFGACEAAIGASANRMINALWQQAAAQGISVVVSSGDSGVAGCDWPWTTAGTLAGAWRLVPDVSLNASTHDGYLMQVNGQLYLAGGTSASAPAMAGLVALLVQKTGARVGNLNTKMYTLAGTPAFHDVTSGSISVP